MPGGSPAARRCLPKIALDPPTTAEDLAGDPLLDEDYLVLSTIHSAKGLEWDAVYVIHASDGNIPSDMATGSPSRSKKSCVCSTSLLTRAKDWLYVCFPQRYFHAYRGGSATNSATLSSVAFCRPT